MPLRALPSDFKVKKSLSPPMKGVQVSRDDIIAITISIVGSHVRRIFIVDTENSSDIIIFSAFKQMGINGKELNRTPRSLIEFNEIETPIIEIMLLHMNFREAP